MIYHMFSKTFFSKNKLLPRLILILIIFLGVGVNYVRSDFYAHGSDEFAYMRVAAQEIFYQNKIPTFFYPNTNPHILPYSLGIASLLSSWDIPWVFRITHIFLLILIVLSFYRLGCLFSQRMGLLTALFVALYPTSSAWQGLASMVPSTFLLLTIAQISIGLIQKKYLLVAGWYSFIVIFYWWGILPLTIFLVLFFLFSRGWTLQAIIFIFSGAFIARFLFFKILHYNFLFEPTSLSDILVKNVDGHSYFDFIWSFIVVYIPIFLGTFGLVNIFQKKDSRDLRSIILGLIFSNIFILFISVGGASRSSYLFYSGIFLFLAYFIDRATVTPKARLIVFILIFFSILTHTASRNYFDVFGHQQTNHSEIAMMMWLREHNPEKSLILSDYNTMEISQYFLKSRNGLLFNPQDPDYVAADFEQVTQLLVKDNLTDKDYSYISTLKTQTNANVVYFVVSGRTRSLINHWNVTGDYIFYRVLQRDYSQSPIFLGENKFRGPHFILRYSEVDPISQKPFLIYEWSNKK